MEVWKDVVNYEGIYQVSDLGNIKSLRFGKEKLLKQGDNTRGYLVVRLLKDGVYNTRKAHQLVAEAFLNHKPKERKLVVNHKNFIRSDNRLENLELVTQRENANRKHLKIESRYTGVRIDNRYNKWTARIRINGKQKHLGTFTSEIDAHLAYENKLKEILQKA